MAQRRKDGNSVKVSIMKKEKFNGLAKWVLIILAFLTIFYNVVVMQTVVKNDLKHFGIQLSKAVERIERIEQWVFNRDD